jgi:DNA polymerase-3 subunit delta'
MEAVWQHFKQMVDHGRLAHAHLVVGSPAHAGRAFALLAAKYMLCKAPDKPDGCACPSCRRVDEGTHGDFHWVEPQGKSRLILVEQIEQILRKIYETAFEGGWKVIAIGYAERMHRDAGNKLLKALEEPPPNTLILLVSGEPQSVLGTLVSRCQKLVLHDSEVEEKPFWHDDLYLILRQGPPMDNFAVLLQAGLFRSLFDRVKETMLERITAECKGREEITDEMLDARATAAAKEAWASIFALMEKWYRDLYLLNGGGDEGHLHHTGDLVLLRQHAARLNYASSLRRLRNIDTIMRRIDRNLPVQLAFETGLVG